MTSTSYLCLCLEDIADWLQANLLKLNDRKTDVVVLEPNTIFHR